MVYAEKASGKIRLPHNDAIEEALCFDWIDSTVKSLDVNQTIQRFTQREPESPFSQANKERLRWLVNEGMVHPLVLKNVQRIVEEEFIFPKDIITEIKKWLRPGKTFKSSRAHIKEFVLHYRCARSRPEEFQKRLVNFMDKTKENKLIRDYGGIEKYC